MKVGDEAIVQRKKKIGEIYYDEEKNKKKVKIEAIYNTFVLVTMPEGYKECFRPEELKLIK